MLLIKRIIVGRKKNIKKEGKIINLKKEEKERFRKLNLNLYKGREIKEGCQQIYLF